MASLPLWPLLAVIFSFVGAVIIGYNQHAKLDGRELVIWRVAGILPLSLISWMYLPWPTDPMFYAISGALGVAAVAGDVLLMNAANTYGGRLASMYVPMKMLLAFALWCVVEPASLTPLVETPWKGCAVLACFGLAGWGMNHIRRNDLSLKALLAVLPTALIFAGADVIEKYVLPAAHTDSSIIVGASMAMLTVIFTVGALPAMVWLGGLPRYNRRTALLGAGFGVILMGGISLLLVTFVLAPNPGYVAAITCLSTVWLALWGRFYHNERSNPVALVMLVAAAIGVAVVVG
ncbi:MAG: hypothetical protein WAZ18_07470 [Alphaproteobacteria bacterium]